MPTSFPNQIFTIISIVIKLNPESILDIGCGSGKYGVLVREYLENWFGTGKLGKFKHRIDAIEVYKEYITPMHEYVYDNIYIGEATSIVSVLENEYNLVLLIDVIEHLPIEDGTALLKKVISITDNLIVSTPIYYLDQGSIFGNINESHKSLWKKKHFNNIGNGMFFKVDENLIWFFGKDLKKLKMMHMKYLIKKYIPLLSTVYKKIKFTILFYKNKYSHLDKNYNRKNEI